MVTNLRVEQRNTKQNKKIENASVYASYSFSGVSLKLRFFCGELVQFTFLGEIWSPVRKTGRFVLYPVN